MTELYTAIGIGLCALATLLLLRELRREYAPLFLLGFTVLMFAALLPRMSDAVLFIRECAELAGGERIEPVVKALGVTFLTSTACEICRSAGESTVGSMIETAGRVEILLLCVPLFRELFDLAFLG